MQLTRFKFMYLNLAVMASWRLPPTLFEPFRNGVMETPPNNTETRLTIETVVQKGTGVLIVE